METNLHGDIHGEPFQDIVDNIKSDIVHTQSIESPYQATIEYTDTLLLGIGPSSVGGPTSMIKANTKLYLIHWVMLSQNFLNGS